MAAADTSFPAYVLERRLALAKTLLERAEDATASVAEIAARCGFTSAPTFSSALVRRHGIRASDLRSSTMQAQALYGERPPPGLDTHHSRNRTTFHIQPQ